MLFKFKTPDSKFPRRKTFGFLRDRQILIKIGGILLLLASVLVLAQMVLAKNGNGGFQIKDSYIEVQKTDYPN